MLLTHVKSSIQYKLSGARKLPEDVVLASFLFEAMYYVAGKCVPNELIRSYEDHQDKVMRPLQSGRFLTVPEFPDFTKTTRHLLIDEDLTYAIIYYTIYIIGKNPDDKAMCDDIIYEHISKEGIENYGTGN